jgi:hypothetical protein
MYKIQYEITTGIWEAFVIAENELEALHLLQQELDDENYKIIRLFDIREYKNKGVIADNLIFR